jgi:uncharacterized membrane protein YdjX (TVP38/TMEM64 family)
MYESVPRSESPQTITGRSAAFVAICVVPLLLCAWHYLHPYLSLDFLQQSQRQIAQAYGAHPWIARLFFLALVTLSSAMAIPGTVLFCLAAGATFGIAWGIVLVSVATAIGATASFWTARIFWRTPIQRRFAHRLHAINQGVKSRGGWYLLSLRLTPVIPFALINLLLGLTHMRALKFYLVTQIGMLLPIAVYVNAGRQLAQLQRLSDVLNPVVLTSFVLLGLMPLLASWVQRKRPSAVAND